MSTSSSFCGWTKSDDGVFHLKLTGEDDDGHHYLSTEGLEELRAALSEIRALAAAEPSRCRGLITSASSGAAGSFCDGIDHARLRASMSQPVAAQARAISDGLAAVAKELLAMPMPTACAATGRASSLGLALAFAHDDLAVLGSASYALAMVEDVGIAVQPHVAALVREKTDRWYTLTTLKTRWRDGEWMRKWHFADAAAATPDAVLREAQRLVDAWGGADGAVHADMRRQLYCESWKAVCAVVPDE